MKIFQLLALFLLAVGFNATASEPVVGVGRLDTLSPGEGGVIFIEFSGRWTQAPKESGLVTAGDRPSGLVVIFQDEKQLKKQMEVFEALLGERVRIVFTRMAAIRGGCPMVRIPPGTLSIKKERRETAFGPTFLEQ